MIVLLLTMPMAVVADYLFKTLDARDGLTSSQINCIMKDSRGYVWFGTPASVSRNGCRLLCISSTDGEF